MCTPWAICPLRTTHILRLCFSDPSKIPPGVYWIFQKLFILEGFDMGAVTFLVHMHKKHGFFIPDVEFLEDSKGFLAYLGLKVKKYYMCLSCNDGCHPFSSLEAVQKHMKGKIHCKVHYGDGGDDEEEELEEFYDYSSRYLIRLLVDPPLHHIYRERNILACMASETNLGSENATFRNPPSQLLDVLLDDQVGRMHTRQIASTSVQATGEWRSNHNRPGDVQILQQMLLTAHLVSNIATQNKYY